MSVQVRYCCQLSSDQVFLLGELWNTGGFQKFLDLGIVAKGFRTSIFFLSSNVWLLVLPFENETCFPFFSPTGYEIKSFFYGPVHRN